MYSFTKSERLLKRKDFLKLSDSGKKAWNKHFTALYLKAEKDKPRIGITVSKKVGHAVRRNKIKRLIREYFRLKKEKINGVSDINVIAKRSSAYLSSEEIFLFLKDLFEKVSTDCDN